MTKAAQVLNVAQPALSRTIHNLEQELGTGLFDHVGKRIILNEKGEILLRHAMEILDSIRVAENAIREMADQEHTTVNLCVKALGMMIDDLIRAFKKAHPAADFQIVQYDTWLLKSAPADLTLFSTLEPYASDRSCCLLKEKLLLAVPANSPLSGLETVKLEEVAGEPIVGVQNGSDLAANITWRYKCAGFEPQYVMDHYTSTSIADMVSLGMGYAYIPEITWPGIDLEKVSLLQIEDADFHRYINLSWPAGGYMSEAAKVFRAYLTDYFRG
jgi:DNA-binding transcriptional LysR family regulator